MSINVVVSSTAAGVSVSGGTSVGITVGSVGASVPVTVGGGIGPAGFLINPGTATNAFGTFQLAAGDGITISTSASQFQIATYGTTAVSSLAPVQSVAGRTGNIALQASDVTAGTFAIARIPTISYTALANVPTSLSPSAHTHSTSDVVLFASAAAAAAPVQSVAGRTGAVLLAAADVSGLASVASSGSYTSLQDVPSTFTPAAHQHAVADVTGLQAALDSKSGTNHGHDYVTALNSLTGSVTIAAGNGVTVSASGSTLTIGSTSSEVDGGFYEGYVPLNQITIVTQPAAQTASGGAATFSVAATSSPGGTLSYQWQRQDGGYGDFVNVADAESATLSLSGLLNTVDDADRYRVVVSATNAVEVISSAALLTVPANVITITTQPTNQTASGGAATFTTAATVAPSGTPTYQWQRSADGSVWANVSGATSASLALTGLTVEADGGAQFRVVVSATNAASVTSSAATLTVEANNTITITSQPSNQTASGGTASFSVAASSSPAGTPAYQWQKAEFVPARSAAWAQRTLPSAVYAGMNSVAYGGGLFAAVGSGSVAATSPDGVTWTQRTLPYPNATYDGIVYGNGVFLAVAGQSRAATSQDGIAWTQRTLPFSHSSCVIAHGGGLFVALPGGGTLSAASTDGINWQAYTAPLFSPSHAAYGNGIFVAIGRSYATCLTSTNGTSWTSRAMPVSANWSGIAYGSGLFVVTDQGSGAGSGAYLTSPDGITWTQRTLPVSADWRSVTYGDGAFVAVSSGTPSTTLTSTDGLTWTQRTLPSTSGWRAVGFGGGTFVALSNSSKAASASPGVGAFSNVSGATASSLVLTGTTADDDNGDQYRVVVSAANAANVTSQPATLTVS